MTMTTTQPGPNVVRSVWTSDEGTMARDTAITRWPKIVQQVIDDIERRQDESSTACRARTEGMSILIALAVLKTDIMKNAVLSPIQSNGAAEVEDYNRRLEQLGKCSWHESPWLYAECYLYRRVQSMFDNSTQWQGYDVFKEQKDSTLRSSKSAVEELANRYMILIAGGEKPVEDLDEDPAKILFAEMTELALWGNATDLSLLHNLSLEDIQKLQGKKSIEESQRNIVDNDTDTVWNYLRLQACSSSQQTDKRVDIVLDNAGFELFADMLYAGYVLEARLASRVVLHAKCFPWFVSDALPADLDSLLECLESHRNFDNRKDLDRLTPLLRNLIDTGTLSLRTHPFWTGPASFHELPAEAPDLFKTLQESHLTIWKGDLNYRKLTRDGLWPHTTPFKEALGPMGSGSGIRILALRTNKSDTCVGLESEERVRRLDEEASRSAWVRNGKYGVVSYSDGR